MKKLVLALMALAVAGAVAPAAQAKQLNTKIEFDVFGSIGPDGNVDYFFAGSVKPQGFPAFFRKRISEGAFACALRRDVELFRDEPEAADVLLASTRAKFGEFFGEIELPASQVPGTYFAQVSEEVVRVRDGRGGTKKVRCLGATSAPVIVPPPDFG